MAKKSGFSIKLNLDAKEYRKNLRNAKRDLENIFGGTWSYLSRRATVFSKRLLGIAAGLSSLSVKMGAEFERHRVSLERMLGSVEAADKKIRSLKDFATRTPFKFNELIDYEKKLIAMGFSAKNTEAILESLGNAASGLGMDSYGLDRLIKAFSDIKAKGILHSQEMRQLAEAGIPAWEMLAEKIGKSVPEAMKMAERGEVTSGQAIVAILDGIDKKFSGMMDKQAGTLLGNLSNISGEIGNIMTSFGVFLNSKFRLSEHLAALLENLQTIRIEIDALGSSEFLRNLISGKIGTAIKTLSLMLTALLIPSLAKAAALLALNWRLAVIVGILTAISYGLVKLHDNLEAVQMTVDNFFVMLRNKLSSAFNSLAQLSGGLVIKSRKILGAILFAISGFLSKVTDMAVKTANFILRTAGKAAIKLKSFKIVDEDAKQSLDQFVKFVKTALAETGKIEKFFASVFRNAPDSIGDWGDRIESSVAALLKDIEDADKSLQDSKEGFFMTAAEKESTARKAELKKLIGSKAYIQLTPDGYVTNKSFEKAWKLYVKPAAEKIADPYINAFKKIFKLDPASKLRRELMEKSLADAFAADSAKMLKEAESLSLNIEKAWISKTKTKLEQLEIEYNAEKEQLEKLKAGNENYLRDLLRLEEIYGPQIEEERRKVELEEFNRMSDEALRKTQTFNEAMVAQASGISEAYAKAAESMELSRFGGNSENIDRGLEIGDWSLIQENLTREYAAHEAHVKGIQELYHTKSNFMIEAARSAASYTAEVYNYMYNSVSQGITDLIVSGKSFGDILKNIGNELIAMVVKWTVQRRTAAAFSKKLSVAEAGQSAALAKTTAAAWADAAALVSLATFGANAAAAAAGMASVAGMAKGMAFLADGGVVTKPTIAMIGEGGEPEAVVPLSKFKEIKGGNVSVNVYNSTPAEVKTKTSFDGTKTIIDFFIDGYSRNVNGVRDIVRSY